MGSSCRLVGQRENAPGSHGAGAASGDALDPVLRAGSIRTSHVIDGRQNEMESPCRVLGQRLSTLSLTSRTVREEKGHAALGLGVPWDVTCPCSGSLP